VKEIYARALVEAWRKNKTVAGELRVTSLAAGDGAYTFDAMWGLIGLPSPHRSLRAQYVIAACWPFANDALWAGKEELAVKLLMKHKPQSLSNGPSRQERAERDRLRNERRTTFFIKARSLGPTTDWHAVK
jgi:hypothetical protein